jgi:hypothetical protein
MLIALLLGLPLTAGSDEAAARLDALSRFAELALDCVHQEYPNKIAHVLSGDQDVRPPRELTPAFYGCFDWHSAVHGHWLLARLARLDPESPAAARARKALAHSLTLENLEAEAAYLDAEGRESFERPYGLAWLLQLAAELRQWDDPQARQWLEGIAPLEDAAVRRLSSWLPKLAYPIRTGEHSQTAFAFGLVLDWSRIAGRRDLAALVEARTRDLYLRDRGCPLAFEPSGQDFLSPCLAEADLVRRILPPVEYAAWLGGFLPELSLDGSSAWLPVAVVTDRADGKLAHLDGLNLSRAWMLEGIASGLPDDDPRCSGLRAAAAQHSRAAISSLTGEHYSGGHWLGTFAAYLVTRRGID